VKTLLFDHDGTLMDSLEAVVAATNGVLTRRGLSPRDSGEILRGMRYPTAPRIRLLFDHPEAEGLPIPDPEVLAGEFYGGYDEPVIALTRPYPGIPEALVRLKEAGWKLGVVSNCRGDIVRRILESHGLLSLFDAVLGEEDIPAPKPDPRGLLTAAERLGALPQECWYVGDSEPDLQAALGAGIPCALVGWGTLEPEKIPALNPRRFFRSARELEEAFLNPQAPSPEY